MNAHRFQLQAHLRQFAADDFGLVMIGAAMEILGGVETDDVAWRGASRASGALNRGGLADAADFE